MGWVTSNEDSNLRSVRTRLSSGSEAGRFAVLDGEGTIRLATRELCWIAPLVEVYLPPPCFLATGRAERDTWVMSKAPTDIDFYLFAYSRWSDFNSRSSKEEFWRFLGVHLGIAVTSVVVGMVLPAPFEPITATIYFLYLYFAISAVPWVALNVRRLHDTGRSGWVLLVSLVPLIGIITMLVLQAQPSTQANKWGTPRGKQAIEYACSGCGRTVPDNAEYCPHCGGSFGPKKCPTCEVAVSKGQAYCMKCGESLP